MIEADGGSRGNPGPAAYGAVLKDADTGEVIAEDGSTSVWRPTTSRSTRGLIGGLQLAAELAPHAEIEVRMDSKLVVEQMSGRWKIKHPDMKPLALEANRLAPFGTTYTWMPREQNQHADRLANEALDGLRSGVTYYGAEPEERRGRPGDEEPETADEEVPQSASAQQSGVGFRGWSPTPTCADHAVLVRHGVTPHTVEKRFSGGLASSNPGLSDEGRDQVRATAEWLSPLTERVDASSPLRYAAPGSPPTSSPTSSDHASRRSPPSPRWSSAPGTG